MLPAGRLAGQDTNLWFQVLLPFEKEKSFPFFISKNSI